MSITPSPHSIPISPTLTKVGLAAVFKKNRLGLELELTHVGFGLAKYEPDGDEVALREEKKRVPITGGGRPFGLSQVNVYADVMADAGQGFWCGEIGFYAGDVLFAVFSQEDGERAMYISDQIVTLCSYALGLAALPPGSVTVMIDGSGSEAQRLLDEHEAHKDPHPQYAKRDELGDYLNQYTRHDELGDYLAQYAKHDELGNHLTQYAKHDELEGYLAQYAKRDELGDYLKRYSKTPKIYSGDQIYVQGLGILEWVETSFFSGYRSPEVGGFIWDTTATPRAWQIDAYGAILKKSDYAGLWGFAQENALVITAANWSIGQFRFVDISSTQFRVPDLRDMFIRATGTDANTGAARGMGGFQSMGVQQLIARVYAGAASGPINGLDGSVLTALGAVNNIYSDTYGNPSYMTGLGYVGSGVETRPPNTALVPRIHA